MLDSVKLGTNSQLSTRELPDLKRYSQDDDVQPEDNWERYMCKTCGKPKYMLDDAENTDPSWVPETCAVSAVFTTDLILQEIFSTMTRRDLISCRFVCRRWSVLASKALQKFHTLTFCQLKEASEFIGWGNPLRPLQHLMYHINHSLSPKSHFPCTSYVFTFARLNDRPPQLFFKDFGPHITKLKLVQAEFNSHGPILIEDMETLVLTQMPNLKQLELSGSVAVKSDEKQVGALGAVGSKSNVKYLEFSDIIQQNILEDILNRSSKLNQVELQIKKWHYCVRHENSPHLLRKIKICIASVSELAKLEDLVNNNRYGKWNVQEVYLDFSDLERSFSNSFRVVNVLNNISSLCSPSCKKLVWNSFDFTEAAGLKIRPMPNVTHLTLNYSCSKPFFPKSVILKTILPNLTDIVFDGMSEFCGLITHLLPNTKPVLSVKRVSLILRLWEEESLRRSFKKLFPNSKFVLRK